MAWYDPSWGKRREVTVDNTGNSAKTDYPVKISLTSGNFTFADAETNGEDVRVCDADETTLIDFWIQDWDQSGETGTIWVEVPSVPNNASKSIYLYYNKSGVATASAIGDTFTLGSELNIATLSSSAGLEKDQIQIGNNRFPGFIFSAAAGSWKTVVREQSGVVYDSTDLTYPYKLYFCGQETDTSGPGTTGLAVSSDAETWVPYYKAQTTTNGAHSATDTVITLTATAGMETGDWLRFDAGGADDEWKIVSTVDSATQVTLTAGLTNDQASGHTVDDDSPVVPSPETDDPWVLLESGTYHMFTENNAGGNVSTAILHFTSSDGLVWTADGANPVLVAEGATIGSPIVFGYGANWYMLWDGDLPAGNQSIGQSVASTLTGANWVNGADNPIIDPISVSEHALSDIFQIGSTWYAHFHNAADPLVWSTTDTPDTWDNTSFSAFGSNDPFCSNAPNITRANEDWNVVTSAAGAWGGIKAFDVLGTSEWTYIEWPLGSTRTPDVSALQVEIDSVMLFKPAGSAAGQAMGWTTEGLALTNDFAVGYRMKRDLHNQYFTRVSVGATVDELDGTNQHLGFVTGYTVRYNPDADVNSRIERITASATTTLDSGALTASAYAIWELSYLSDGTLALTKDGAGVYSASDSNHLAVSKEVMIAEGVDDPNRAESTWDWLYVRSWDGEDPSQTVGSAESAPTGANEMMMMGLGV